MNIAITGAGGMLGSHIMNTFNGTENSAYNIQLPHQFDEVSIDLLKEIIEKKNIDVIINCAAVRNPKNSDEFSVNANLPRMLYDSLLSINKEFKLIHMSSINVLLESRYDSYSNSKRAAEEKLVGTNSIIIRPNLIWSKAEEGDRKRLIDYMMKLPIVPIPYPGHTYWPVDVELLAQFIKKLVDDDSNSFIYNIFGKRRKTLWELSKGVAKEMDRIIMPIPTSIIEKTPIRKLFPISLRSTDTSIFNYGLAFREDISIEI